MLLGWENVAFEPVKTHQVITQKFQRNFKVISSVTPSYLEESGLLVKYGNIKDKFENFYIRNWSHEIYKEIGRNYVPFFEAKFSI